MPDLVLLHQLPGMQAGVGVIDAPNGQRHVVLDARHLLCRQQVLGGAGEEVHSFLGGQGLDAGDIDDGFNVTECLIKAAPGDQVHSFGAAHADHMVPALRGDGNHMAAHYPGSPGNGNPHGRDPKPVR